MATRSGPLSQSLLEMFASADKSSGPHPLTLSVGRDGIMLPMRNEESYREGSVGTVTVMDRNGRRVGTVYLGQMPESLQPTMTADLTRMVTDVLAEWSGEFPRLVYVTDAGCHQTGYYETLCGLAHPRRPGETLSWQWVVDYFHACEYLTKLSKVLFTDERSRLSWSGKMRRWLKHKPNAVFRILHSAAKYHSERTLTKTEEKEYRAAYQYLLNHREWMEYSQYRFVGLPIGSGVTEAGCKIVFTQRFKCSGMRWSHAGGASILRLRLAKLSGVWKRVYERSLECPVLVASDTKTACEAPTPKIAA